MRHEQTFLTERYDSQYNETINMTLQEAKVSDITAMNEIMRHSLSYWDYTPDELNKIMNLFQINEPYLLKNRMHLAYHHHELCGFFSLVKNSDHENELDGFYIKKELIGRGYGKSMWDACCQQAKSLKIDNFIIMSTPSAESFYKKMGAKTIGSRPSKIRKGVVLPLLKFFISPCNEKQ